MLMYCLHKYTCTCTWKWTDLPLRGEKCWRFIAPLSRSESRWHHSTTPVIQNFACPRFPYLHVHGHNFMHVHGKNILSMALMAHVKRFKAYWGQFFCQFWWIHVFAYESFRCLWSPKLAIFVTHACTCTCTLCMHIWYLHQSAQIIGHAFTWYMYMYSVDTLYIQLCAESIVDRWGYGGQLKVTFMGCASQLKAY